VHSYSGLAAQFEFESAQLFRFGGSGVFVQESMQLFGFGSSVV
jgi:hypothetical protein